MREEERLCGLEWKDINFKEKTLKIQRTSQLVNGKGIITKETKTEKSRRTVNLSDYVLKLLKSYKIWQRARKLRLGDIWKNDTDRLFTKEDGSPTSPDTISAWFHKFIMKTDLPKIHLHSLRHIHATLMLSLGVDIRTLAGRLGHSNTSTTLEVYSHYLNKAGQDAAEKFENMMKNG